MREIVFILLQTALLMAITNEYYKTGKEGWFFYKEDKNETKKEKKIVKKDLMKLNDEEFINNLPFENLDTLSAEEFKKVMDRTQQIAVMKPTKKNVLALKRLQKYMLDQSEKFAKVWYVVTMENPNELEYPQIKTTPYARTPQYYAMKKKRKEFFQKHKDDLGFVVFINPEDKMQTIRQKWVYKSIKEDYPEITIKYVNAKERPDLLKKFKIKELPDNFFIYKNSKGEAIWQRIGAGLMTKEAILKNTIFLFENAIMQKDK